MAVMTVGRGVNTAVVDYLRPRASDCRTGSLPNKVRFLWARATREMDVGAEASSRSVGPLESGFVSAQDIILLIGDHDGLMAAGRVTAGDSSTVGGYDVQNFLPFSLVLLLRFPSLLTSLINSIWDHFDFIEILRKIPRPVTRAKGRR